MEMVTISVQTGTFLELWDKATTGSIIEFSEPLQPNKHPQLAHLLYWAVAPDETIYFKGRDKRLFCIRIADQSIHLQVTALGEHPADRVEIGQLGIALCRGDQFFLIDQNDQEVFLGEQPVDPKGDWSWWLTPQGIVVFSKRKLFLIKLNGQKISLGNHHYSEPFIGLQGFYVVRHDKTTRSDKKGIAHHSEIFRINESGQEISYGKHSCNELKIGVDGPVIDRQISEHYDHEFFQITPDGQEISLGQYKSVGWHVGQHGLCVIGHNSFLVVKRDGLVIEVPKMFFYGGGWPMPLNPDNVHVDVKQGQKGVYFISSGRLYLLVIK